MYAVVFDMDTNCLTEAFEKETYHDTYRLIRTFMENNDFVWKQGSVYFGGETIDAVTCVVTVQKLAKKYNWFRSCVRDIRMLRIEENNDLMPAISL